VKAACLGVPGGLVIDGRTRLVGVIGWPVSHTRSPAMHNAAFVVLGLNYVYVPMAVRPEALGAALRGLAAAGFVGINVTVPHKEGTAALMDELSPIAAAIGSANTVLMRPDGSFLGDSTDGIGFLGDLAAHGCDPAGRTALLLGAGGAARAVAYALASAGAQVCVANRTMERAEALCEDVALALPTARLSAHRFPADLPRLAGDADLIVNATSLGLHAGDSLPWDPAVPFHPGQTVYDLIYTGAGDESSRQTPLLRLAAQSGAQALDGLGMLVRQGAASFELWTGQAAPIDVMMAAAQT
jgi:shikimate dehydrogenase